MNGGQQDLKGDDMIQWQVQTRMQTSRETLALITKLGIGLMAIYGLCGCGSSLPTGNGSAASGLTTAASSTSAGAECNQFSLSGSSLAGNVTDDYVNGSLQASQIRLRLTSIDVNFSNYTEYLQIYRWKADSSGNTTIDPTPVSFTLAKLSDGSVISGTLNYVSMNELAGYAINAGMTGTTAQDFFSSVVIILNNLDYSWNAAKVALYDESVGTTAIAQVDVLLPIFPANPNTYAASHPLVLSTLHPFWFQRTTANTDATWLAATQSFCF